MEINEFAQKVCRAVEKELGEAYRAELKEVKKNNGVLLHGLLILPPESNVAPTIYLETFHAAYEDGVTFREVLDRILEIFREETPRESIDMSFFKSFEKVRDRICYRLINRQSNRELLRTIPYVEFLDLAICFYYAYSDEMLGEGSILIHNSHMEHWNIKVKDLMIPAGENTPRLFPGSVTPMREMLEKMLEMEEDVLSGPDADIPLLVLTNRRRIHGAACMLYPGMLDRIGRLKKNSFYIIPSSVHEVLILEKTGAESTREIKKIIREVNRQHVSAEEILSDNLYYYDLSAKTIKIIL
ncbi:MAG: DUF5688 family protein [Butyrivibrio sp.]|nr:DUF5688 family protein [Acetatifactor muris]MCM1559455.1 DUF5688 family protein [Butyrivibrio sp.]